MQAASPTCIRQHAQLIAADFPAFVDIPQCGNPVFEIVCTRACFLSAN